MRIFLITAVAVPAVATLFWQFTGDENRDDAAAANGEIAAGAGREAGPSSAGAAHPEAQIVYPQSAGFDGPDLSAPLAAAFHDQRPPGAGKPAPSPTAEPGYMAPDPEFSPDPAKDLIQTMIEDGAPAEVIAGFERSFALAAMSPEERREAATLEPQYVPPTPEQVEGLIWNAYFDGDIPADLVHVVVEEHWKQVEEEEMRAFERGEVPSSN